MLFQYLYRFMVGLFAFHYLEPGTPGASLTDTLDDLKHRRDEARAAADALIDTANRRGDQRLLASEERTLKAKRDEARDLGDRISELEASLAAQRAAGAAAASLGGSTAGVWTVGREARTYRPDGPSYFADLVAQRVHGDMRAADRLRAHEAEVAALERRDISRTDGSGGYFVPPAWLTDEWVAKARPSRVTADLCSKLPLPAGTDSINLPKVSTGTATAIQTADNATVQETDLVDTAVSLPVRTIAGQQDVALQVLDQSPGAFDQVIFADLMADYAQRLDSQVLSGTGSSGQVVGILSVGSLDTTAYTDGSPTVPELYPKIADSINEVETNRYLPPEGIVMHPRRWNWMLAALDSSNRPLVVPTGSGPHNAPATLGNVAAEGAVGTLLGLPVYIDPNVTTTAGGGTEDVIIVARFSDHYLFESPVRTRVLPEVGSGTLTVRLQLYGYVAFTAERYSRATSIVSGTGLAAPAFS